ncbi:MAG: AMP-binding protein [Fretibacterium sp.]|nr:AMP-binding protein [Fretibacterium sp.]
MSERLNEILDANLQATPDAKCYWYEGAWHSCAELTAMAGAFEDKLKDADFSKGQRLVAMMPNCPATLSLVMATWRQGGVFCPLNEKAGEDSLLKTLDLLQPFVVVVSGTVKKDLVEAISSAGWPCVSCPDNAVLPSFTGKPAKEDPEELAVIFSTSGTTGDPKAVPLTHANLIDNCRACLEHVLELRRENIFLNVLPNFHAFGFTISLTLPLFLSAPQVLIPNFMPPQRTLQAIIESGTDTLLLVPTMVSFLTALLERAGKKLSHVKILIAGGDRYNVQMDERVTAAFGTPLLEGYGITECSPVLAVNRNVGVRRLGTVGEPLPRFELQLRDEEGHILDGASEGVLWTRGPSVTSGYYRAPEVTAGRFDKDGWFNTGDYVQIVDGRIKVLDRVTDIIIVGGFNVYPQEVEATLATHPAVQAAVVVGTPSGLSGEVPKAFVVKAPDTEVTEKELIRFCKERLSHYKVPRDVEFLDTLPISSTGKVLRRVLRQYERENTRAKKA